MTFGQKLRALREGASLTQSQLAEALSVTRQAVYKWESDKAYPEAQTLIGIRGLFGVSLDVLLLEELSLEGVEMPRPRLPREGKPAGAPAPTPPSPVREPQAEKRRGLFSRLFGEKA